ncbi:MAG TPA: GNAT family N-acetyltransferase [Verrucomicrobiae bacterium]|nr:GNAT family N-acetyltransferase [Verrucomicrobiae bacterium]
MEIFRKELTGVIIRGGTVRDWSFIHELALEAIAYSMSPYRGVSEEHVVNYRRQTMSGFWSWVQRSQSRVFIAEEKERLGYLILNDRAIDELTGLPQAWIMDIAVKKEYWSKGVGRKLIEQAEQYCRENGIKHLGLAVTTTNVRAASLYTKMGFHEERKLMVRNIEG